MSLGGAGELSLALVAVDKATPTINKVKRETAGLGKQVDTTSKSFSAFSGAISVAAGVMIRDLSRSLAGSITDSMRLGASVDTLRVSFDRLIAASGTQVMSFEKLKTATGGMISDVDLLRSANQAMSLGLPIDELDQLYDASIRVGAAQGITATRAINDFTIAIGRQSPKILDNFGIQLDQNEAYEEYAKILGKATEELTENEKKTAFATIAIKKLRDQAEIVGDNISETQKAQMRWNASIDNLKTGIGKALGPLNAFVGAFEPFMPMIGMMTAQLLPKLIGQFGLGGKAMTIFGGSAATAALSVGALFGGIAAGILIINALPGDLRPAASAIMIFAGAITAAAAAWLAFHGAMSGPLGAATIPIMLAGIGTAVAGLYGILTPAFDEMEDKVEDFAATGVQSLKEFDAETAKVMGEFKDRNTQIMEEFRAETLEIIGNLSDRSEEKLKEGLLEKSQGVIEEFKECATGKGFDLAEDYEGSMQKLVDNTNSLIKAGLLGQAQESMAAFAECTVDKEAKMVDQIEGYIEDLTKTYDEAFDKSKTGAIENADTLRAENDKIGWDIQELANEYSMNQGRINKLTNRGLTEQAAEYESANEDITAKIEELTKTKEENLAKINELTEQSLTEEAAFYDTVYPQIQDKIDQLQTWKAAIIADTQEEIEGILGDSVDWQIESEEYLNTELEHILEERKQTEIQMLQDIADEEERILRERLEKRKDFLAETAIQEREITLARIKDLEAELESVMRYWGIEPYGIHPIEQMLPSIQENIQALQDEIDSLRKSLGAPMETITRKQYGGWVRRPTLTLLGEKEPELVVPLSRLRERGATPFGVPVGTRLRTVNMTFYIGQVTSDYDARRAGVEAYREFMRRIGERW